MNEVLCMLQNIPACLSANCTNQKSPVTHVMSETYKFHEKKSSQSTNIFRCKTCTSSHKVFPVTQSRWFITLASETFTQLYLIRPLLSRQQIQIKNALMIYQQFASLQSNVISIFLIDGSREIYKIFPQCKEQTDDNNVFRDMKGCCRTMGRDILKNRLTC